LFNLLWSLLKYQKSRSNKLKKNQKSRSKKYKKKLLPQHKILWQKFSSLHRHKKRKPQLLKKKIKLNLINPLPTHTSKNNLQRFWQHLKT